MCCDLQTQEPDVRLLCMPVSRGAGAGSTCKQEIRPTVEGTKAWLPLEATPVHTGKPPENWELEDDIIRSQLTASLFFILLQSSLSPAASLLLLKCNSDHDICSEPPKASHLREAEVGALMCGPSDTSQLPAALLHFHDCSVYSTLLQPLGNSRERFTSKSSCLSFLLMTFVLQNLCISQFTSLKTLLKSCICNKVIPK